MNPNRRATLWAFRKQVQTMMKAQRDPWFLLLMWEGQEGIERDDLIGILKEETGKL